MQVGRSPLDTTALTVAATRVEDLAAVVRARRFLIAAHAERLEWRSPAARMFFDRVDDAVAQLAGCAAQLDALAESLQTRAIRLAQLS